MLSSLRRTALSTLKRLQKGKAVAISAFETSVAISYHPAVRTTVKPPIVRPRSLVDTIKILGSHFNVAREIKTIPPLKTLTIVSTTPNALKATTISKRVENPKLYRALSLDSGKTKYNEKKQEESGPENQSTAQRCITIGGFSLFAAGAGYTLYKVFNNPLASTGEQPIYIDAFGEPKEFPLNLNQVQAIIKSDQLEEMKAQQKSGHLGVSLVASKKSGQLYVKKGASSLETLCREFSFSKFLHFVSPEVQPDIDILATQTDKGNKQQLFTLSHKVPGSVDMEDFILSGVWKEKLKHKPLLGLEVALAAKCVIEDHDIKFSNLIVIETEKAFLVASIDHELAGLSMVSRGAITTDVDDLFSRIRDRDVMMEECISNVCAAAKGNGFALATEFLKMVRPFQSSENIRKFYQTVADTNIADLKPLFNQIDGMSHTQACNKALGEIAARQLEVKAFLAHNRPVPRK